MSGWEQSELPKYPHVKVKLVGEDGNAFAILGRVAQAMKRKGIPPAEVVAFLDEARKADYNHLLATCMRWVDVR